MINWAWFYGWMFACYLFGVFIGYVLWGLQ